MIVIGDYIIDKYLFGTAKRLSPEAPVPVIEPYERETRAGGAANVVVNLEALGHKPLFIYNAEGRPIKTRIFADGHLICRLDEESYEAYCVDLTDYEISKGTQYAILSDYNKGVIHDPQDIIFQLNKKSIRVLVDPKKPFVFYKNAYLIKANKKEFEQEIGEPFSEKTASDHCWEICDKYKFQYIIVTLGPDGCFVYKHESATGVRLHSEPRTVVDVTGAGDVFMASLAHFMLKYNVLEAARIANHLAGISVEHLGTYVLQPKDLGYERKTTIFTNGCFDILHPGHIHLLKESKKLGNKLIVGLNSDASIKRLKGNSRPILNQVQRKAMLEALDIADEVIIFDEDTPIDLIEQIKPDVITKGGDYKPHEVVGHLKAAVVIIPTLSDYSTTSIINKVTS